MEFFLTPGGAAAIGSLIVLVGGAWRVWPILARLARFMDDVHGEPARPGAPRRPGWGERLSTIEARQNSALARLDSLDTSQTRVIARLERVESATERVRAQTENSHQTNLRDDLDRVTELVTELHQRHGHTRTKEDHRS